MLLVAAGSLWLFLAAVPVFADGGPHVAANNSGVNGISADGCAGCHRAHRAQGEFLLLADSGTALCLTCHGATGLGSTVDVEDGIQYSLGTGADVRGSTVLGYTRGGGFVTARIGSGEGVRVAYLSGSNVRQNAKVPVRTAGSQPVTSAHLPNVGGVVGAADGVAWGNGPNSLTAYAGPEVDSSAARATTRTATASIGSSIRSRNRPRLAPMSLCRLLPASTSPTRPCRPPATPATTPSSRHSTAPTHSLRARSVPSVCPQRRATTSEERFRGTGPAARRTTRRTASPPPSRPRSRRGAPRATAGI